MTPEALGSCLVIAQNGIPIVLARFVFPATSLPFAHIK